MPRKFTRVTEVYEAVDSKKRVHTVHVHTEFVEEVFFDGPVEMVTGLVEHRLENGNPVDVASDGNLRDKRTGLRLRKDRPPAESSPQKA
jgi:hypothetical protein